MRRFALGLVWCSLSLGCADDRAATAGSPGSGGGSGSPAAAGNSPAEGGTRSAQGGNGATSAGQAAVATGGSLGGAPPGGATASAGGSAALAGAATRVGDGGADHGGIGGADVAGSAGSAESPSGGRAGAGFGGAPAGGGGAGAGQGGSGGLVIATGPVPDLRVAASAGIVEIAALRVAAGGIYPGKITISNGGVDDVCGNSPAVDLATNAETQLLRASASANCSKVRVIFTLCEALYRIIAKKSAGITTLADLAGKRIMAPSGTSSAYFVSLMLGSVGLTTSQVTLVSGTPNGSSFNGGNAPDAVTIWEPGVEQASEALGPDAVEFRTDAGGTEIYRELVNLHTTTDVLADATKRRGLVALVRSLIVASAQIRADPSVAYAVLTGPVGVSQAVLEKSLPYERFAGTLVPDLLDVMTAEEPWRANTDNRAARSREELAKFIDASVLSEALAGL